jgi:hypothetical protein
MVWHIFKKDWKLLWQIAVGVAFVNVLVVALMYSYGHFGATPELWSLVELLEALGPLATACLIAALVHQDAIPGVRQDWLVRPIRRTDLLLSKLLFVLVAIQGPVLAANLAEGLASGFGFGASLRAAGSEGLYLLFAFDLPVLALASVTSNFMEAVVAGLGIFLALGAFMVTGNNFRGRFDPANRTGLYWVPVVERLAFGLLGAAAVLRLQYYRRKTVRARWLLASTMLLCMSTLWLPWQAAFAIEQRLSPIPGAGNSVAITFEPSIGKFRNPSGVDPDYGRWRREGDVMVYLPVRVSGLPTDVVLEADHTQVRLAGTSRTQDLGNWGGLEIFQEGPGNGENRTHQGIRISGVLYERIKDQPVRLEIDYSLTLLPLSRAYAIPALHGDERLPGAGWCKSKVNDAGTAVQVRCLDAGKPAYCGSAFLEHVPSGQRNPAQTGCDPDYAPYFGRYFPSDAIGWTFFNLPFRDATGLAKYPVDGSRLAESRVVLRLYEAKDHFARRVVTSEIRLSDWQGE